MAIPDLHYEVAGHKSPLVLVHGFTLDRRMWNHQFAAFAESFAVLRYDLRGFGLSPLPDGQSYSHWEDLALLLDHLGWERASLVGLSMGGRIAAQFALQYPERVDKLVLVDSALDGYQYSSEYTDLVDNVLAALVEGGLERAKEVWLCSSLFIPAREIPSAGSLIRDMIRDYTGWHWTNNASAVQRMSPPVMERLGDIQAQTMVIVGQRDLQDFQITSEILHTGIAGACKRHIPRAGHMSPMEQPALFNQTVLDFLRRE